MTYQPDREYQVTVTRAAFIESQGGTPGVEVDLNNPEAGTIAHRWYITEKTKERFVKSMAEFGITAAQLAGPFWENDCEPLVGSPATITTEEDTYNGRTRVRCRWVNGPHRVASTKSGSYSAKAKAAAMFGGTVSLFPDDSFPPPEDLPPIDDDHEVPL